MTDEEMQQLVDELTSQLGAGWIDIVEWLRSTNSVDAIEFAIRRGSIRDAVVGLDEAAIRFASDTYAAYASAANRAKEYLDNQVDDSLITFNAGNPRAAQWATNNTYQLRGAVTQDQQATIHQVVARGVGEGVNPREIARDVRDSIGLTDYQESIVNNYRRELEQGDYVAALSRELRSGRYDRSLQAAIAGRRTFDPDERDRMVEDYRQNWIGFRAETISRTEALRSAHEGTEELYQQAVEAGQIDPRDLIDTWHAGPNTEDAREGHQMLDKTSVPFGQAFVNPITGIRLRYPGDPQAPVSETANCRCGKTTKYRPRPASPPDHFVPVGA
jgi:hypothetical protein